MEEGLKVFVDRLHEDHVEKIDERLSSTFLDVHEKEFSFSGMVEIKGQAYIASDHLVVQLTAIAKAEIPCAICNKLIEVSIEEKNGYFTESLEKIKSGVYDYSIPLREALLLEIPQFVECHNGQCPERESLKKYLKKENGSEKVETIIHFPFAALDKELQE